MKRTDSPIQLLVLADIHGRVDAVLSITEALAACDAVVVAGDLTDFGSAEQAEAVLSALAAGGKPLIAVGGNCDPPAVDAVLNQYGANVGGCGIESTRLRFVGVGGAATHASAEADFAAVLEAAVASLPVTDRLVLVTHQPAYGTSLDRVSPGRHVGNRAIRAFIDRYTPMLAVSGHLHDRPGADRLGSTVLVNPGPLRRGCYAIVTIDGDTVDPRFFQV